MLKKGQDVKVFTFHPTGDKVIELLCGRGVVEEEDDRLLVCIRFFLKPSNDLLRVVVEASPSE